jgi:hypothetical protein
LRVQIAVAGKLRVSAAQTGMVRPLKAPRQMTAKLRKKKWLFREWEVTMPSGDFTVIYSGLGIGHESVRVNGEVAVMTTSWIWFVPTFEFNIAGMPARVDVRVWPWFTLRSIRLQIGSEVCYSEGF